MKVYPQNITEKLGYIAVLEETGKRARSEMGLEEVEALKPISNVSLIEHDLTLTSEMMNLLTSDENLPFDHVHDIREAAKRSRIVNSIIDTQSMLNIRQFCATCRLLRSFLNKHNETWSALAGFAGQIVPQKELEDEIGKIISDHAAVKDNASAELSQIRRSIASRKNELRSTIEKIIRRSMKDGYMAEQEATIRNGRMVLPVKAEHKRKINGFVQDVSATGQTVYMEPAETLQINNDIRELETKESREIERLLTMLTAKIGAQHEYILSNAAVIGRFDLVMAKASFSLSVDGSIPDISKDGAIRLFNARNPNLILKNKRLKEPEEIIPLNLELGETGRGLIITGPNAGGKSVALKTTGICQLLMQSGFAIPADPKSSLPVFDGMFLDMGDEQSIDQDLSTFSSRLTWMRETAKSAEKESLILVDEAGTGTDPEEGVSLYQSFLEEMSQRGCMIIATTHHGNLKVFAHEHPGFENGSMAFDQKNLSPTYLFQKGVPGSSYAFEIGQRIGVQDSLLERARELVGSSKNRLESLIVEMEQKQQEAERLRRDYQKMQSDTEKLRRDYEQRLKTINSEKDKIREKALNQAREIMENANARIEEAVQKIVESQASKESIKEARESVSQERTSVDKKLRKTRAKRNKPTDTDPPKPGDAVTLTDSDTTGELIEVNGKQAIVEVNGMRLKTKYKNLTKTEQKPEEKKKPAFTLTKSSYSDTLPASKASPRLDIRGFRGEEAVRELTHFMDRAASAGLQQLEIIHGKGNGILKKIVHEELKKRKEVRSFDFAPWDQGGPGCTVVKL